MIRPFKVGDYVEAAGHGGTVEQIGLFYTQLVTPATT
ncbi:mechanosensitive ion channel domain-containing protein [Clostridioides difficile]